MPPTPINDPHPLLANPVWSALTTQQMALCIDNGQLKHFPPTVAPFCAVEHERTSLGSETLGRLPETVYFLGATPSDITGRKRTELGPVLQMVHNGVVGAVAGGTAVGDMTTDTGVRVLEADDVAPMIALINLAYPGYFRADTASMGTYVGIHHDGELVAMAGQRLHVTGYREISGVCTRPGHTGRGHSGKLMHWLIRAMLAAGERPFLHVSTHNVRALALYQHMGFDVTRTLRHARLSCSS